MTIQQYLANINQRYLLGNATEHTFRGDLQQLIESLVTNIQATNEPKRQSCGAPDYILTKKDIPVGFIEAKDIGDKDLEGKKKTGNKEQFDRYKASLSNLIFTDYLDFHLYNDGEFITKIAIGEITEKGIKPIPENFTTFENLLKDFCLHVGQTIKSSKKLAEMMAGKARLLSDVIEKALTSDETHNEDSTLKEQMLAFKDILIHDITPKGFADVYAQTIAYGLFAARLHDPTLKTFSRQEAAELIPKSNPFLRKLFGYIAGPDIDDRIKWIVDNLTEIFLACNVEEILKNYGKSTKMEDPIIHFYETFLSEYDPKLRKARGVWYTPAPVVNFIVRAVDDILKTEFNLPQGLADTSKTNITVNTQIADKRSTTGYKQTEQEVHKVQILDPATGTGTFLAEVIKHIHKKFKGQEGIWSSYVDNDLLPRLNGFELLMASYAMAHLQLDLLLKETGFRATKNQRTRVYLTNSLEEHHPDTGTLFANWLSSEANEANHIKRDTPVMCIIGNPPYSVSSTNRGVWIQNLLTDYKKNLNERKLNLDDDYIKFIRYGQYYIEKNGEGVLAYISNNSFIDGITHRQMRKNILETFDKVYILDLHGNSKKNELCQDGSPDQNVFDIMQGVSINIFVKTGQKKKNELGTIFHSELFGKRNIKYTSLNNNSISKINWQLLENKDPYYFFVPKDFEAEKTYNKFVSVRDIFKYSGSALNSERNSICVHFDEKSSENVVSDFNNLSYEELQRKYQTRDSRDWKLEYAITDIKNNFNKFKHKKLSYKPFDTRWIYYTGKSRGYIGTPSVGSMQHMLENNLALITSKQSQKDDFRHVYVSKDLVDRSLTGNAGAFGVGYVFPLYLYPETTNLQLTTNTVERVPNLNLDILKKIEQSLKKITDGFEFPIAAITYNPTAENNLSEYLEGYPREFGPLDLLDYIYAVLHSPNYREKYKEFLKIDFPRVPYPKNPFNFWRLVKLGSELRNIHLLESETVENYSTTYPESGDNKVDKPRFEMYDYTNELPNKNGNNKNPDYLGAVYINDTQYFADVPTSVWEFYIGGYQPAQKWLKDRKGRTLTFEDILHYQKIIVALSETNRIMQEIDKIDIE